VWCKVYGLRYRAPTPRLFLERWNLTLYGAALYVKEHAGRLQDECVERRAAAVTMRSRLREAERAAAAAAESASRKDGECAALRARLYAKEDQLRVREGTLQRGGGVFRGLKF